MSAMPHPASGFGLSIGFADGAVVGVAGELDLATASDLAAVLDALIDRGHPRVTIDCSQLRFIDATGIGILATAQARLAQTDREVRLRSVSGQAYRVLAITKLLDVLHVERPELSSRRELSEPGDTDPIAWEATRLAAESARADALAETMWRLTTLIPEIITACDGASVTLRRPDYLITAAASDDTSRDLDYVQYANRQGPCLEAATSGIQTFAAALAREQRWQSFTPQARERGIESILSSPLLLGDRPTGALNLYSRTPHAFLPIHRDLANVFAKQAAMLQEPVPTTSGDFVDRIHDALNSRDIIARAQGVLMERLGTDARNAFITLRRDSVRTSTPLRIRAGDIIAETQEGADSTRTDANA